MSDFVPGLIPPLQTSTPIDDLRARIESILTVFDDPHCAPQDIPDWVRRVTSAHPRFFRRQFTVCNFIRAMRNSAAALGLADGEWYVLEAVCACPDDANQQRTAGHSVSEMSGSEETVRLARGLQRLANAWVAFLLWPFFAPMEDHENSATGLASPCIGLAFTPKAMAAGEVDPGAGSRVSASSYPLREAVLRRDGYKRRGCSSGGPGIVLDDDKPAWTDAVRIFKHPLVVYKDVYDIDELKRNSTLLSLELLRCYSQLSDRYIRDMGSGVMDDPENLLTLNVLGHSKFDHFKFCFVPTQVPNTYKVVDHDPRNCGMPVMSDPLPETVTFHDHTTASGALHLDADGHPSPPPCVGLPNPELLRTHAVLGSVLHMSGVVDLFVSLVYTLEREKVGNVPFPTPDGVSFWKDVIDPDGDVSRVDSVVRLFEAM
ncbi:hypothetical protein V8D89_004225 [Ganoderma adspersum]